MVTDGTDETDETDKGRIETNLEIKPKTVTKLKINAFML